MSAKSPITKVYAYETGFGKLHRDIRAARYHLAFETIQFNLIPFSVNPEDTQEKRTLALLERFAKLNDKDKKKLLAALRLHLDYGNESEKGWEEWTPEINGLPKTDDITAD